LEDLESKYNVAIEREVLLDEEIKNGEQEREALRIESQRLRDELSDLKIEADIVNEKLRRAESEVNRHRKPAFLDPAASTSQYPEGPEHSPGTTASSPTVATPPAKSVSSATSDAVTPPSPTASESSVNVRKPGADGGITRTRISLSNTAPRPGYARHTRTPSIPYSASGLATPSMSSRQSISRLSASQSGIPRSGSLYQIRGLIGKMQKLEERVHSARSRLPAPVDTPTGTSPRTPSAAGQSSVPSSVTVRKSSRKRSSVNSSIRDADGTSSSFISQDRQAFGRPAGDSRPSSRTSMSSRSSIGPGNYTSGIPQPRPDSRQSLGRSRTPLGHYSTNPATESRRPRSSLSSYAHSHGPSSSMSYIEEDSDITTPTPRRGTLDNEGMRSSIPTPGSLKKRPSGSIGLSGIAATRRSSSAVDKQSQEARGPAERRKKLSDLGETF
jgi:hypothetical protein